MSDVVERLRSRSAYDGWSTEDVLSGEAADTIEALRAEKKRLKEECDDHKRQSELHRVMWQKTDEAHDEAVKKIARLRELLKECADDMEAECNAKHGFIKGAQVHSVTRRLYERDMVLVRAVRAEIGDSNG